MRARIEARAAEHDGVVGLAVVDLASGEWLLVRGDEKFPTASVIKVPVLVELFHQVAGGRLRLEDTLVALGADKKPGAGILRHLDAPHRLTVADAVYLMIAHSDNTAANLLIDRVGIDAVNRRLDAFGLRHTRLYRKLFEADSASFAPDSAARWGVGVTTPREMTRLFERIYRGEVVSPAASARMIDILKKQFHRTKIPRDLPPVEVANKTGEINASRNDCGIVYGRGRDFALCVFTKENRDQSWTLHNRAEALIGELARIVYDGLVSGP